MESPSNKSHHEIQGKISTNFDKLLMLNPVDAERKKLIAARAVVGNFSMLELVYKQQNVPYSWEGVSIGLRMAGGVGITKGEQVYIDSERWQGKHALAVIEHESTELILQSKPEYARQSLDKLGLLPMILEHRPDSSETYTHYLAVVYELAKAKEQGVLDEHIAIRSKIDEELSMGEFKEMVWNFDFDKLYREKVKTLLMGGNHA
jgi:hypothetical protein